MPTLINTPYNLYGVFFIESHRILCVAARVEYNIPVSQNHEFASCKRRILSQKALDFAAETLLYDRIRA